MAHRTSGALEFIPTVYQYYQSIKWCQENNTYHEFVACSIMHCIPWAIMQVACGTTVPCTKWKNVGGISLKIWSWGKPSNSGPQFLGKWYYAYFWSSPWMVYMVRNSWEYWSLLMFTFSHQRTPLYWPVWRGDIDMVRCLCDNGADPNIQDSKGVSKWGYCYLYCYFG